MAIKLTVREAIAAQAAIERMPRIPDGKVGYALGRIADFCEQEASRYRRELIKLQKELTIPGEGLTVKVKPDKQAEYLEANDALLDTEVEIPREPLTLDQVLGPKEESRPQIEPGIWKALSKIVLEK